MSRAIEPTRIAIATLLALAALATAQPPSNQPAIDPAAGVPFGVAGDAAERRLESFLQNAGLDRIRAQHMAARLMQMRGESGVEREREDLVRRLAQTYVTLIDTAPTLKEQAHWEREAERLLDDAEGPAAEQLRLGLARAAYGRVERTAEAWIIRTADEADRAAALRRLASIEERLIDIAEVAASEVDRYERLEERAPATAQARLDREIADAERRRSIARYLAGWAAAYAAELERDQSTRADHARRGLRHFGRLLNAPDGQEPTIDRLREGTLGLEHVARSALAVSTLRAITGDHGRSLRWLDTLEKTESLHPDARDQLFLRRAIALAIAGQWGALEREVAERRDAEHAATTATLSPGEARRIAVLAFEAIADQSGSPPPSAAAVRDAAMADLVAAGELGHVLDLAGRYGFRALGGETFVAEQVRGLTVYGEARERHRAAAASNDNPDTTPADPTSDPVIAEDYRRAAAHFAAALDAPDAQNFPRAIANTAMLRGLALFYAGFTPEGETAGLLDAADLFIRAAEGFDRRQADRAAQALWLAIRAHDLQLQALTEDDDRADAIRLDRDRLIERFLDRHPASERAAALRVRRAIEADLPTEEKLRLLASVPTSSPLAEHAQRHAARLAYRAFSTASGEERAFTASRYTNLAQPLLVLDRRRASAGDAEAASLAAMRARRIAEAVMAQRVPDLELAERTLDVLQGLIDARAIDTADIPAEITYRRAQIALARGDRPAAAALLDTLIEGDTRFAAAAQRLLFRDAERSLERALASGEAGAINAAARSVIAAGLPIIERTDALPPAERPAGMLSVYAAVADALAARFRIEHATSDRDRALALYQRVLEARPRALRALRGAAEMAEAAGLDTRALEYRRTLLAGVQRGTEPWFEARLNHLRVLARTDPNRARLALDQHNALYPAWGPEPWGDRLRALAQELGVTPEPAGDAP